MIGKITAPRGERVEGLIYYLFGPGRREEHTDPHIVAGWRHPAELEPPLRADGRRDFRRLLGLLNQPHAAMGSWGLARPVWHCSMRAAPGDKMLSDDERAQIACDVMNRTGLSPFGQGLIRLPPRTRPGPRPIPCTRPPRPWEAGSSATPPTLTTGPPEHPSGVSLCLLRLAIACGGPPGSCRPTGISPATRHSGRSS